ncbi:deoxynucleoside kinase [Pseudoteredinibacter isoporae]|uniref:Deoxyadenosine/deoxycytidine kinase n=1 Tax=Pseudoteredinibacter isoporae TaxID=570281 RepID=A0A7X0JVE6_9GAMM|nr:deoxynucleoside kinase [Pseudoteredinibacter isoporae]MBB6522984.1 deoxyadenosine/deoxycytidine kinase [Pseudoteredinibacter isoporae]NHO88508.1 deoxynucleoside kinase [Pseudoteredinibacter isoporae]NIB22093.1 deoxynucleoside kinase [Pseudoteredinibacter isoporae]
MSHADDISRRLVAIEGPIGVGKTAFASKLAQHLGASTLLDNTESNPFLSRFYSDPKSLALQTQLFFLFERIRQLEGLQQNDLFTGNTICDFLIDKDQLFAHVVLDEDELKIYQQVFSHLKFKAPTADLVVVLQAPAEVLFERINQRGIEQEQNISLEYLQQLNDAYTQFFHHYQSSPLLMVNASDIDPVNNDDHFFELLEYMKTIHSGRHYYNPNPTL